MCLGNLPARYGADLNNVLYPPSTGSRKWLDHYLASEVLELESATMYLHQDVCNKYEEYADAAQYAWDCGRQGVEMSVDLVSEIMERWTGCCTYRRSHSNIGVEYTQIVPALRELLGAERWGEFEPGWCQTHYQPTRQFMAEFHIKFEKIHPFMDGNGRLGRLLLLYYYGRLGQQPCLINDREAYLTAMRQADVYQLASML